MPKSYLASRDKQPFANAIHGLSTKRYYHKGEKMRIFLIMSLVCLPLIVNGCSLGVSEKKDVEMPSGSTSQSAEDVMNTFVKAFKNMDFEAMGSLMTGTAKEEFEKAAVMGFPLMDPEIVPEMPAEMRQMVEQTVLEHFSRLEVVSSKYVGDEFHFKMGGPPPEMPEISGMEISKVSASNEIIKMRKENGVWRIYDSETLD